MKARIHFNRSLYLTPIAGYKKYGKSGPWLLGEADLLDPHNRALTIYGRNFGTYDLRGKVSSGDRREFLRMVDCALGNYVFYMESPFEVSLGSMYDFSYVQKFMAFIVKVRNENR